MSSDDTGPELTTRYPADRPRAATIRSRLMLEVAAELVTRRDFDPKQARVSFREQGSPTWDMAVFGSDSVFAALEVAAGETDFAIVNPATVLARYLRGMPPFSEPAPMRAIATIPSYDQLGVAVRTRVWGSASLLELIAGRRPLTISLRGARPDHSLHVVVNDVMRALGASLDAIRSWGGEIIYQDGIPHQEPRLQSIRSREIDVIIDEGIYNWVDIANEAGYEFSSIPDPALTLLESWGYRRSTIAGADYRSLDEDVTTLDFSGFMVYTREDVADDLVTAFCESLEARKDRIPWQGGPALPLERMVTDERDAPVPIPLHPAAERYWRSLGYLA
jgi:NMT1-like family